ncbi:hypothetical protein AB0H71_14975 [Nocardia sp. NPDC050697]|uniref:hypothetical protein n=1 Tax=Nocardia sp. NPDC050697 TaxID=3155158 RepID=UPI0033E5F7C4
MTPEEKKRLFDKRRRHRFPVEFAEYFPRGLYQSGPVEIKRPWTDARDRVLPQEHDEQTGLLVWQITVIDPLLERDKASFPVLILSDTEPVPLMAADADPDMYRIALTGMTVQPRLKISGQFRTLGWSYWATGYAPAPGSSGKPSGSASASGSGSASKTA